MRFLCVRECFEVRVSWGGDRVYKGWAREREKRKLRVKWWESSKKEWGPSCFYKKRNGVVKKGVRGVEHV